MTAGEIKREALRCGACGLINKADDIAGLVSLMGTPQGREFCKKHAFPTLAILRQHKAELKHLNVYVDAGNVEIENVDNAIIVGETSAVLRYDLVDKPYHAIVMHGGQARVSATRYSVCQVINIGGEVEVEKSDYAEVFVQ